MMDIIVKYLLKFDTIFIYVILIKGGKIMSFLKNLKKQPNKEQTKEKPIVKKCIKCGKRDATRDDNLCDSCRFLESLTKMSEERQ